MPPILSIQNLSKTYKSGLQALKNINLDIQQGEIFALLGPNGAGKTTLINIICGIVTPSTGSVRVGGHDILKDFRMTRKMIGLVPQELAVDSFESVWSTVRYSRGLFGKPKNDAFIESTLSALSLLEKKDNQIRSLSGGMKRRVMIAKALSHEPTVLFLDEPTAGVDVELRRAMWEQVHALRKIGVTIILTTHYIEEAEQMADRVGVIHRGELILVEEKEKLMQKLGKKQLVLDLRDPLSAVPESLAPYKITLRADGMRMTYDYDSQMGDNKVVELLDALRELKISLKDISTRQSSLEEIFVNLVKSR